MSELGGWKPVNVRGNGWIVARGSEILCMPNGDNRYFVTRSSAGSKAHKMNRGETAQRTLIDAAEPQS